MMLSIFKVRQKSTGKFSTGSSVPRLKKNGKFWAARAHVGNHFALMEDARTMHDVYNNADDFEVVEFELVEKKTYPIKASGKKFVVSWNE